MKTYRIIRSYGNDPVRSTDLQAEALRIWDQQDPAGLNMDAGVIEVFDGDRAYPETADYLYCPEVQRLGIAWGADATWADVPNLDSGILMWLNDPDAWQQAN